MAAGDVTGKAGTTAIAETEARWSVECMFAPDIAGRPSYESASSLINLAVSPSPLAQRRKAHEERDQQQASVCIAFVWLCIASGAMRSCLMQDGVWWGRVWCLRVCAG